MRKLTKSSTQARKVESTLQFDKESKINIQTISNSQENDLEPMQKRTVQLGHFDEQNPLQSNQKKTYSEKKIVHVFSEPKSMIDVSLKTQIGRYKDLINISEKRLVQSLKRITLGSHTQKQSKKIKSFEIPFSFISQSVDLVRLNKNQQKSFITPKMPDLLKIKLKKQLQSIQKNQKPKKPHFMRNHNKSHIKRQSTPLVFQQYQFDKFQQQKRHQRAKQKARKNIINERKLNNFKKVQKSERKDKISITINHTKDNIDFKKWEKRTVTEETIDVKFLGNQRNQAKYSRLLEYVKKPKQNDSFVQSPHKRKSRIKTQSAAYTSLIGADVNILELEGIKITEEFSKGHAAAQTKIMMIRPKIRNGRTTPVQTRPKINMFHKLVNSENGIKPSKYDKYLFGKNYQISPWVDLTQQCDNGLD